MKIITKNYKDTEAFRGKGEFDNPKYVMEKIILNSINVLLKRGMKGLYIFASDQKLREHLLKLYQNRTKIDKTLLVAEDSGDYEIH